GATGRNSFPSLVLHCSSGLSQPAFRVRTDNATLFEIRDVKNLGKFFAAVLTEKYVLGHDRFLLDQFLSAHILTRSIVRGTKL
ncbi:MAG: hypothetical protein ABSC05_29870, partial [Candidatus Solibacter sp.]